VTTPKADKAVREGAAIVKTTTDKERGEASADLRGDRGN